MMLFSDALIVTHVSTHVSLRKAIERVKRERIVDVIRMTDSVLKKLGRSARIAVAGLNPHAGENNSFGTEDSEEIAPAVNEARKAGIDVAGPIAADTVFYRAKKDDFDAVVCMYHDQGHIPVKLLAFESAINVTLGLPIIRTSVDHGTAFDIAYKGVASLNSFVNAVDLAKKLI
jgi:4-hydroxythreonine-4-phosphate dehydrogenase